MEEALLCISLVIKRGVCEGGGGKRDGAVREGSVGEASRLLYCVE